MTEFKFHSNKFISATKLNVCETFGSDRALALYFDLEQLTFFIDTFSGFYKQSVIIEAANNNIGSFDVLQSLHCIC